MTPSPSAATGEDCIDNDYCAVHDLNSYAAAYRAAETFENLYGVFLATCDVLQVCSARALSDAARAAFEREALDIGMDALVSMVRVCDAYSSPELLQDTCAALGHMGKALRAEHDEAFGQDVSARWDACANKLRREAPVSCLHLYKHGMCLLGADHSSVDHALRDARAACMERVFMHGALTGNVRGARLEQDALFEEMIALLAWHDVRVRLEGGPLVPLDTNAQQGQGRRRRGGGRGRD